MGTILSSIMVVNCDRGRVLPEEPFREIDVFFSGPFREESSVLVLRDTRAPFDRIVNFSFLETKDQAVYSGEAFARQKIYVWGVTFISWQALRPVFGHLKPWFRINFRLWVWPLIHQWEFNVRFISPFWEKTPEFRIRNAFTSIISWISLHSVIASN